MEIETEVIGEMTLNQEETLMKKGEITK